MCIFTIKFKIRNDIKLKSMLCMFIIELKTNSIHYGVKIYRQIFKMFEKKEYNRDSKLNKAIV